MKKLTMISVVFLAGLVLFTASAMATPITGEISFAGSMLPIGGTGLSDATALQFPSAIVTGGTGSFASYGFGYSATFFNLTINPVTPATPLWQVDIFQFDLTTFSVDDQTNTQIIINGSGFLRGTGYDDTFGTWNLTGNTQTGATFSFSSTTASVPDASLMLLLGPALVALGIVGRRKRS